MSLGLLVCQLLALLAGGLFTGASVYISIVEHPARLACATNLAATVFGPSYQRAQRMQASLAAVAALAGAGAWWLGGGAAWAAGGFLMFAIVPYTLIAIRPTNRKLLDPRLERSSPRARALLERWGRLHALRSIASATAFLLFVLGALLG